MATTKLSGAAFVKRGYGQVEPNHLSAQRTGQIYAQLPAKSDINVLENGQFVKYNYADGVVDFTGEGEWMLVFNEVKLYHDRQTYEDFAMIKSDYNARVYSPIGQDKSDFAKVLDYTGEARREGTTDPYIYQIGTYSMPKDMPKDTTMVPRVLKTNIGDLFTTNCVNETELAVKDKLVVAKDGYLIKSESEVSKADYNATDTKGQPVFEVAKVYTLADGQPAVKLRRIA